MIQAKLQMRIPCMTYQIYLIYIINSCPNITSLFLYIFLSCEYYIGLEAFFRNLYTGCYTLILISIDSFSYKLEVTAASAASGDHLLFIIC